MTKRGKAEFILFATTFIWGGTFPVIKVGLNDISPFVLVTSRFTLATIILLPFCFRCLFRMDRGTFLRGCFLGFLFFLAFVLQTIGLNDTTASKSAFITAMFVIFTPFFQLILEKRLPQWNNVVGVVIVSIGLWYLTAPEGGGLNRGDFLTLLCAVVFGYFIVLLGIFSKHYDVLQLTFLQIVVPAVCGWVALFLFEKPFFTPTPSSFFAIGYLAILATVVTLYVQTRYLRDSTPTRAVLIFTLEPLWAAILGFIFLHEVLGPWGIMGGSLIIGGILFSQLYDVTVKECNRISALFMKSHNKT